jgi:hypothetical protein
MIRLLLCAMLIPLYGQDASPAPSAESHVSGSVEVGYQWRTDVGGSFDSYRSLVNLGAGPKLLSTEFTLTDPQKVLFDRFNVRAYNWGDDPYGTVHMDAFKSKVYDLRGDYRDIAYFNYLPSYADPLLSRGIALNEQAFDIRRHLSGASLDLRPGTWLIPYVAFERDSGSGHGASVFVSNGNEYPVPNILRDETTLYRGGLRLELRRLHVTLEEGGTSFKDDQSLYDTQKNIGDVRTPVLGTTLTLGSMLASYGIRGSSAYSKGLVTANPVSWLDVYGQFLYSQPDANVHYQETAAGTLYLQSSALFYSSQQALVSAAAKLPHASASLGGEIRPFRRVRVIESWLTDRLHGSSAAASNLVLASASTPVSQTAAALSSSLAVNYNQQETQVLVDVSSKLMLRGGHRYVWGDANSILPAGLETVARGELHRQVALAGVVYRPVKKLSLTGEAEVATSSGAYFRTSLYNYQKVRAQGRYQLLNSLNLAVDFTLLNNQNPTTGVNFDAKANQQTVSLFWAPAGGKHWDIEGSYGHSYMRSTLGYFTPQLVAPETSDYRDNSHTATALFGINLPAIPGTGLAPRLTGGGSLVRSSGSRPTSYYQPLAKLAVPLRKNINWFTEWRYYGYGEAFYLYEGFRTHLVTSGLRFTR